MVETLVAIAQYPGIVSGKGVFQAFAYHPVQAQEVVRRDAFAIRRVGDDDALFPWLLELLERLQLQRDFLAEASCLYIAGSYFVGLRVVVISINPMVEFTFCGVVVVDGVEQVLVEVHPFFESKFLAEHPRSDVSGDECRFDRDGTRTAHRVDKVAFALPSRHQNHSGCQHLVQRSFHGFLTIAPSVERFARAV